MSDTTESLDAAAIRAKLFAGVTPLPVLAEAAGCTLRTVQNYVLAGMPVIHIGPHPYAVVDEAIPWIRNRRQRDLAARRPGRPPNKAA
jgi:hypothetical protein